MMNYTVDELKQLQAVNLNMAEYFVQFCEEKHLLCYLCGGGCIGAVRHKGFIPWDDDLDFFMPRRDYEKLTRLWNNEKERYFLSRASAVYVDRNQFITIRDPDTTMIKPYQKDLDIVHGVNLDVFPIDGYPKRKIERFMQVIWANIYSLFCTEQTPSKHGKMLKIGSQLLLGIVRSRSWRYRIWKFAEQKMSCFEIKDCKNITELCAGPGYMKNCYPKEAFASAIWTEFEHIKLPIPVGYDAYLRIAFGDYMQMPPEEKRIPQHDAVKLDIERSYKEYKGVYYCKK